MKNVQVTINVNITKNHARNAKKLDIFLNHVCRKKIKKNKYEHKHARTNANKTLFTSSKDSDSKIAVKAVPVTMIIK